MTKGAPQKIYRYQSFNARSIDALCHDQLYFSDPSTFNDPLDCKPSVACDSDVETLRDVLKSLVIRRVSGEILSSLKAGKIKGNEAGRHAQRQAEKDANSEIENIAYQATNPEYEVRVEDSEIRLLTYGIQAELLKQNDRGICCFSEEYSNPLLWSHYGDQHKGFCVGYSLDRRPKPIVKKVKYGGVRTVKTSLVAKAVLDNDIESQRILDESVLLRKAEPWGYEKEWRTFGSVGLHESSLKLEEIIFGLRCSSSVMYSIMESLKSRGVSFYRISVVNDSFELNRTDDFYDLCSFLPRTSRSGIEIFGS